MITNQFFRLCCRRPSPSTVVFVQYAYQSKTLNQLVPPLSQVLFVFDSFSAKSLQCSNSFAFQGWGANSNGIGSGPVNLLHKVKFSTITNEVCVDAVNSVNRDGQLVDDRKFCTGPLTGGKNKRGDFEFKVLIYFYFQGFSTCQGEHFDHGAWLSAVVLIMFSSRWLRRSARTANRAKWSHNWNRFLG